MWLSLICTNENAAGSSAAADAALRTPVADIDHTIPEPVHATCRKKSPRFIVPLPASRS
jgi:hypothetical protein